MFTGLIQALGTISAKHPMGQGARYRIDCPVLKPSEWEPGASIAVSGCCLTALETDENGFSADLSDETLEKTSLGERDVGDAVNLEPALRVGDSLGGHYVTGHVDAVAQVWSIEALESGNHRLEVLIPEGFEPFIAPKGSVSLDGVSLTVNDLIEESDGRRRFWVNIIPHTWAVTTLGTLSVGQGVNFEIDLLARYLNQMMAK